MTGLIPCLNKEVNMKSIMKYTIGIILLISIIQVAGATFSVATPDVSPSTGSLSPETPIYFETTLQFTSSGDSTFPGGDDLRFYTDIGKSAHWKAFVILNSIEPNDPTNTATGSTLTIDGWELEYPNDNTLTIEVVLEGEVPSNIAGTGEYTIFKVTERDSNGVERTGSGYTYEYIRTFVDPDDIINSINVAKVDLEKLRKDIDAKSALGVDVSQAEAKYNTADAALRSAEVTTDYGQGADFVNTATTAIDEGEILLNQAYATKYINDATNVINNIQAIYNHLTINISMSPSDATLLNLNSQLTNAKTLLSSAIDKYNSGSYLDAQSKAKEALDTANQINATANQLYTSSKEGIFSALTNNILLIIGVIVAVVLIFIGYTFFRNRSSWDELG